MVLAANWSSIYILILNQPKYLPEENTQKTKTDRDVFLTEEDSTQLKQMVGIQVSQQKGTLQG